MKKLTTLFILAFLAVGLFAEPKFPKYNITDDDDVPYVYVSNDLQSVYELIAYVYPNKKKPYIFFAKKSLIIPTSIHIKIEFSNEKDLDNYIKNINLADIETCFNNIRRKLINDGITPDIVKYNADGKTKQTTSTNTIYGNGYEEHYDYKTLPQTIVYITSY